MTENEGRLCSRNPKYYPTEGARKNTVGWRKLTVFPTIEAYGDLILACAVSLNNIRLECIYTTAHPNVSNVSSIT